MFEGCPEHDFFSQPQLKFPMFVFSFTMFSVKDELLGRWCSQRQNTCFKTRRTVSGCAGHPARGGLWFKSFFCHGPYWGALVKLLHIRLCMDTVVLQCLILRYLFCRGLKKINNVNPICLGHMTEGSAWLSQLENQSSYSHFFYNCHAEVHKCCCLKSHLLQSLTTLDFTSQFRSTIHSPFPVSYHMIISH